ncbi:hypothetical protein AAVH_14287, partial [Aphelenchoides avenae]
MTKPIVDITNFDFDSEKENAARDISDEDPFGVDPDERSDAERFLKQQERLQERRRNKLG